MTLAPMAPCMTAAVARRGDRPYALDLGATLYYEPVTGRYADAGGGAVATVFDWVGTNDASQGTASARATVAARYARNHNALTWDGNDRYTMTASAISGTGPMTLLAVHKGDDTASNRSIFHPSATGGVGLAFHGATTSYKIRLSGVGDVLDGSASTSLNAWCVRRSATTLRLSINGSNKTLDAPAAGPVAPSGAGSFGSLTGATWCSLGKTVMIAICNGKEVADKYALGWYYDVRRRYGVV